MTTVETLKAVYFSLYSQSVSRENMNFLPEAFAVASISGIWRPRHWQSDRLRMLYRAHTCLRMTIMLLMLVSQLMALILLTKSVDDLAEASFLFLTAVNASVKAVNMLIRRRRIVELMDMFDDWKCIPRSDEESKVRCYFDKLARYITLSCMGLGSLTTGCLCFGPLLARGDDYLLSIRAWQPYEVTSDIRYYITQTHQMLALMTMLFWNCSNDFTFPGFMIQICSQLQLMCHRLSYLSSDAAQQRQLMKQSVQHHLHIFEIKRRLEIAYTPAILSQYVLSSLLLCISIYQLTTNQSDIVQMTTVFLYVSTMATELLLYCWFGNEVTVTSLKSSEMVYQANWSELHVTNRKGMLIMMLRSSLPIRIACGPMITLSNESYTRILKLSYSALNVLRRS